MLGTRHHVSLSFKRSVKTSTLDWKPIRTNVGNVSEAANKVKHPGLRRFFFGLMVAMPVISFGLGCWQVKRLNWKVNLISQCEKSLAQEPLDGLPANIDPDVIKDFEYRRFRIKGHFDYSQEMFLGPRMRNGNTGYLVICPFIRKDGGKPILVERGWIRKDKVLPESRDRGYLSYLARPQGEIEIQGFFRVMPKKSSMQFDHEQQVKLFHVPDVEAMAKQSGALPVYCQLTYDLTNHPELKRQKKSWMEFLTKKRDQDQDSQFEYQEFEFMNQGVPIGTVPKVNFTNNHLQYLITWFGVSMASTGLLAYNLYKSRRFSSADKILAAKKKDMEKNW